MSALLTLADVLQTMRDRYGAEFLDYMRENYPHLLIHDEEDE